MKYKRQNLKTGEVYIGEFNAYHHADFAQFNVISRQKLEKTACAVLELWNKSLPDYWHYTLHVETEHEYA